MREKFGTAFVLLSYLIIYEYYNIKQKLKRGR